MSEEEKSTTFFIHKDIRFDTLIEYFYIFGIDNVFLTSRLPVYEQKDIFANPTLISKFPLIDRKISNIDPNIIKMHCFPNGFEHKEVMNSKPKPEIFHFALDNLQYIKDQPKLYYTCMIIYESIEDYEKLHKRYKQLLRKSGESRKLSIHEKDNYGRSLSVSRLEYPKDGTLTNINHQDETFNIKTKKRSNSSFKDYYRAPGENPLNVYIPKAICVCSLVPFPNQMKDLLFYIYNHVKGPKTNYPLERIIEKLVYDAPLPPRNFYKVNFMDKIIFNRSHLNKQDVILYNLHPILTKFKVEDLIDIFRFILLEEPILFFGENKEELSNLVSFYLSVIFPFEYQYPNASILPLTNLGILEIEDVFCFGINKKYKDFFRDYNINIVRRKIRIVDLDNCKIETYYNYDKTQPVIPLDELGKLDRKDETEEVNGKVEIGLPQKYQSKLADRLKKLFSEHAKAIKKKTNVETPEYHENFNQEVYRLFLYTLTSLFKDYNEFIYTRDNDVDRVINEIITYGWNDANLKKIDLYKYEEFNKIAGKTGKFSVEFHNKIAQTKAWNRFLHKKYLRTTFEDKIDILLFDNCIIAKNNKKAFKKKYQVDFSKEDLFDSKDFKARFSITELPQFTNSDFSYVLNHNEPNQTSLLYFQKFYKNGNIKYLLFPKLLFDDTFFVKHKYIVMSDQARDCKYDFDKLCQKLNVRKDTYYKIYDEGGPFPMAFGGQKEIKCKDEISYYPKILWLCCFALTFSSLEENEKEYRFYEMLEILEKTQFVEKNVICYIFIALAQYGTNNMVIIFYDKIKKLGFTINYGEYTYMTNKLVKKKINVRNKLVRKLTLMTRDINLSMFKSEREEEYLMYKPTEEKLKNMKTRTFAKDNTKFELEENVEYPSDIRCNHCEKTYDLSMISMRHDLMDKINKMGPCPICSKPTIPRVAVKIQPYKDRYSFDMMNPYYAYLIFINKPIFEFGLNFDCNLFMKKYNDLYWSMIWHFFLNGLSYAFLLKYQNRKYYDVYNKLLLCNKEVIKFEGLSIQEKVIDVEIS